MSDREKLIELLDDDAQCDGVLGIDSCDTCPYRYNTHCYTLAIVEHLISNGVTVQKWIPVSERLPDNSEHDWVLAQVVENNGYMHIPKVMEYRQNRNDWFEETYGWLSEHKGAFKVTHWMPLPEPPKECE